MGAPPPGPGGYGVPGNMYGTPAGHGTSDEKTWNLVSHFGGALGVFVGGGLLGWVAPLVSMMSKGNQSPNVRAHALEALNFQITWALAILIGVVLTCCSAGLLFFVPMLAGIVPIIFGIIAGVKATNGEFYRYPMTIRMVK